MDTTTATPTTNGYTTDSSPVNNKCVPVSDSNASPSAMTDVRASPSSAGQSNLSTPQKDILDAITRKKLYSPSDCVIRSSQIRSEPENFKLLKERFLLSTERTPAPTDARSSYKHFVDLSSSNLRCVDIFTEENFLCKIVNEPFPKVQMAYFMLNQDNCHSDIFDHQLVRSVRDIIPMSKNRTYVIVPQSAVVYEDLHTYIRNKRRLVETEARSLFHQICQTVQVCHRNGIILRDLKLKRFYFIDADRTKIQYESLEGSMILDDPDDDTLYDKIGCPLYTAPELLCPNSTYAGKPADMWSLGVILYTMLVGQYPFYEKGGCNLITIIRHCQVQIPMALSKPVRWLLRSLLRRIPEERLRAEHILQNPWLEEQKPYYMYVPVDTVFSDSDDDDDDDEEDEEEEEKKKNEYEEEEEIHKKPKRARTDDDESKTPSNSLSNDVGHDGDTG